MLLAVSDAGAGMDAKTTQHIFDSFLITKDIGKGTGLGLSTVFGIVKQTRGDVGVDSEPGRGTTIKICLLRVDAPLERVEPARADMEAPRGSETIQRIPSHVRRPDKIIN